jgi:poly-gamma-glutamate synthesis protein (capsule biosynthesis protein)
MDEASIRLFLAGDVMTGRGVDQILARPSAPELHEPYVTDAGEYVRLAEQVSGPVPRGVASDYIWGDALAEWERMTPAARVVNLETSITRRSEHEPKGINYRMHPDNIGCLRAAHVDICILANNHALDYGPRGLIETLETLERADLRFVGAGRNRAEAARPVVARLKLPGDVAVLSIHWGGNWGYDVPRQYINFAHRLVEGGIDIVYGHSSHHVRPIEIYRGRLVLYGCGDFIDDYEGITGYERYRDDLVLMFFPTIGRQNGQLQTLEMTPLRIRHMRLNRASLADAEWICETVNTISRAFGTRVALTEHGALRLGQNHA